MLFQVRAFAVNVLLSVSNLNSGSEDLANVAKSPTKLKVWHVFADVKGCLEIATENFHFNDFV